MIHASFFTDEAIGELQFLDRLLFLGMITLADDGGVVRANPAYLRASLFPYDDSVTVQQVSEARDRVAGLDSVMLYEDEDGRELILFLHWLRYQKINRPVTMQTVPGYRKTAVPRAARRALAVAAGVSEGRGEAHCFHCNAPGEITWAGPSWVYFTGLEIGHKVPLSQGGTHSADNLILTCRSCTRKREPVQVSANLISSSRELDANLISGADSSSRELDANLISGEKTADSCVESGKSGALTCELDANLTRTSKLASSTLHEEKRREENISIRKKESIKKERTPAQSGAEGTNNHGKATANDSAGSKNAESGIGSYRRGGNGRKQPERFGEDFPGRTW